jgi:hypothetical protein
VQVSEAAVVLRESQAAARRTSSSPPVPARKKKLGAMSAPAGYAEARPALVCAGAPRTAAIAEEERKLSRLAVVAVAVGRCPDLELADVARLMAWHFRLHDSEVRATMRSMGEYLLCFDSVAARYRAVQWQGPVHVGPASFMLSPWTRFREARASKMFYKARVCLEGVPADVHQVEVIRGLFGATDIIERIDDIVNSKEESACCKV